ncbi:DUF1080 domain-containing protein [Pedobacter frigidisoli]|uniref:DUF1080 domain-containing protein n=2 Tax=Pedobacter frigidisoli TaxID=2530455 RepID=A0A4R0P342_9SPHI|nr:DUF1080 domain-containing protein [Pedobacter frigidisoli]
MILKIQQIFKRLLFILTISFFSISVYAQRNKLQPLFNGKDLVGWSKYIDKRGLNNDPKHVISVKDSLIHVTGEEFGYIATNKSYKNFRLLIEFKWGEQKFSPRENDRRDAGICFYVNEHDNRIWPKSAEFQIQEGDVGDLWLIDNVTGYVDGLQTQPKDYARITKKKDAERPKGEWNALELICMNGKVQFIVNGVVVNEGERLSVSDGRILLQSEGAELYYRNIKIEEFEL